MAFDTITGDVASSATVFGGTALNKIANFLNGGGSEVANIYHNDLYIVDSTDSTKKIGFNVSAASTATTVTCSVKNNNNVNLGCVGTHEIFIPAGAMFSNNLTNGAAYATRELATNDVLLSTFNFDTTTSEKVQFNWATPANWDAGTVRYKLYWTYSSGSATQTIDFDLAGVAFANDDPMDTAFGTAQNVTDTVIAINDLHVTSYSSAITIAGSPVAGELVYFQLSRDTASDNLSGDAEVIGILLEYSTNKSNTT